MSHDRLLRRTATALAGVLLLAGCSGGTGDDAADAPEPSSSTGSVAPSAPAETASPAHRPAERACYALDYDSAVAPTSEAAAGDCAQEHTTRTFAVGDLDLVVDGHLLAVDSRRAQRQPARRCTERLPDFLGGGEDDLRLSVFRAVWFSPTVEESDEGADWYRCDVIALAGEGRLEPLTGGLEGILGRPDDAEQWRVCGTAEPGTDGFERVPCGAEHTWRALSVVDLADSDDYPGEDAVRSAGQGPCEDAARDAAADPLNFRWGYEWPTAEQWDAGQRYGLCWTPA